MKNQKYFEFDRVKPLNGYEASFLYVVTAVDFDQEQGEYVYQTYKEVSPTVIKYFLESEVEFAGAKK